MKEIIRQILNEASNLQSAYDIVMTSNVGDIILESDVYQYVQKIHNNYDDFIDGDLGERIGRFSKYKVVLIDIDKINTDEYYLDDDMMDDYIDKYENNKSYPPIVLGYYDSRWGYNIIDGNHRVNALKSIGVKKIKCLVGLNEHQKTITEARVKKSDRVDIYRDENVVVVAPLTHEALQKYANECSWCINSDEDEWIYYHQGDVVIIIQRKNIKVRGGLMNYDTLPEEIYDFTHGGINNEDDEDLYKELVSDIYNFDLNIVYYRPKDGLLYDKMDNCLSEFGYTIWNIPNMNQYIVDRIYSVMVGQKKI